MTVPPVYPPTPQQLPLFVTEKRCTTCHIVQPFADFYKDRQSKDGYRPQCKACMNGSNRAYRETNHDKIAAHQRAYYDVHKDESSAYHRAHYQANREARKDQVKQYREANRDKALAAMKASRLKKLEQYKAAVRAYADTHRDELRERYRAYYLTHSDQHKERCTAYRRANSDKLRAYFHRRRVQLRRNGGHFTARDIMALFEEQHGRCAYCDVHLDTYHIEHKTPVSRGGTNWPDNLCLACPTCNHRKFTKTEDEFRALLDRERLTGG